MRNEYHIPLASTSVILDVYMEASGGGPLTGLGFGDMTINYMRQGDSGETAVTEATMTLGTWATGGWIEVDATNYAGWYQFGVPDAVVADAATSPRFATLLFEATGAVDTPAIIHLEQNVYQTIVDFRVDDSNSQDEYTIRFYKNGAALTNSDIGSPRISVTNRDNTALISSQPPTLSGTEVYNYDALTTERTTAGQAYSVTVQATIDGKSRISKHLIGRDSS